MKNTLQLSSILSELSIAKLLDILLDGDAECMWSNIAEIILEKFPDDSFVVSQIQSVSLYTRDHEGKVTQRSNASIRNLRAPEIYNSLNLGFSASVRSFHGKNIEGTPTGMSSHLKKYSGLHTVTYDILDGDYICASIALYGSVERKAERVAFLKILSPTLKSVFERIALQSQKSITHSGLTRALKHVPYGIVIMNWAFGDKIINNEGLLKCLQWNENRDTLPSSLKIAKQRFSIPMEIIEGWDSLRQQWLENENTSKKSVESKEISCSNKAQLSATVSILNLTDSPFELPCFMVQFSNNPNRSEIAAIVPDDAKMILMSRLTPSERTILHLLIEGKKNSDIAVLLHRQESTIKEHLTSIYSKTEMRRSELIRFFSR